ncbi:MAG: type II toxin-antitoxin system HicB family antitoxin [Anaerolineae bacterium]
MRKFVFPVVIEKDKDGYFVSCPALQGCYTQGDSYEEALTNIEDAIRLHIGDRLASGEPIPTAEMVSLVTTVEEFTQLLKDP